MVFGTIAFNPTSSGKLANDIEFVRGLPAPKRVIQLNAVHFNGANAIATKLRIDHEGTLRNWYSGVTYAGNNPVICNFAYAVNC